MRLDKFLKDSRLVKRRTIAKQMCDAGKVLVNDKRAKAGVELTIGDTISIEYKTMFLKVQVESVHIITNKVDAKASYCELERKPKAHTGVREG